MLLITLYSVLTMMYIDPFLQYEFHCNIDEIWSWIQTATKFSELITSINKKLSAEPLILSQDKTYQLNSKFICYYQDKQCLNFTIEALIETDYYHMVKWRIDSHNNNNKDSDCLSFIIDLSLHYMSYSQTLLTFHISISEESIIKLGLGIIPNQKSIQTYCQSIDWFILNRNDSLLKMNCESRIIKAPLSECVNYFENARICTGLVGKVVSLTNEDIKKGTIVINAMKQWGNGKDEQLIMQVREMINKTNSFKSSFFIYRKNEALPLRSMDTELFNINDKETFVVLTHHFFIAVDNKEYNLMSSKKRKFLKQIGNIIETLNNNNPLDD